MNRIIASLVSGRTYERIYSITGPTIASYAGKVGAKVVVLSQGSYSLPHYAKFQIGEMLASGNRVLFLDCDVIVRSDCTNLFNLVPENCAGLYNESTLATPAERQIHKNVMIEASTVHGLPTSIDMWNTGVMMLSPMHEKIFSGPIKEVQMRYWEQPLINAKLNGYKMMDIGYNFNRMQYIDGRVPGSRLDSYIIHYAGILGDIGALAQADIQAWKDAGL